MNYNKFNCSIYYNLAVCVKFDKLKFSAVTSLNDQKLIVIHFLRVLFAFALTAQRRCFVSVFLDRLFRSKASRRKKGSKG